LIPREGQNHLCENFLDGVPRHLVMLRLSDKRIAPKTLMRLHLHFAIASPLTQADDIEGSIFGHPAITEAPTRFSWCPADAFFTGVHFFTMRAMTSRNSHSR
jgi:hypothetical protein